MYIFIKTNNTTKIQMIFIIPYHPHHLPAQQESSANTHENEIDDDVTMTDINEHSMYRLE